MSRAMAWLSDQFLIWLGYALIIWAFAGMGGPLSMALIILGIFLLDFCYFAYFEMRWAGQSPGKRWFGIRVISARGGRLKFADVLIRNLMRPIDLLPFAMVLGGTVCVIDRWHRRLGDLAAETLIIRDATAALPQTIASEKSRVNSFQADAAIRNRILTRIDRAQRDLILDLAIRRDQIEPATREALFAEAASYFRKMLGLGADQEYLSDEQTVINLALVIQSSKFTA